MNTDFFIDLLYQVKEFENSEAYKPQATVEDFRIWLNDKKYRKESPTKLFKNEQHQVSFTENEICKQVLLLGRYSKLLIRKGLNDFLSSPMKNLLISTDLKMSRISLKSS